MPSDDRDPKFERGLAHHLRQGPSQTACPDAETLAAYHERSLSLEELSFWKVHLNSCAACQEALALLETTDVEVGKDWKSADLSEVAAGRLGRQNIPAIATRMASPVMEAMPQTAAKTEAFNVQERKPHKVSPLVRWGAPLGAIAAVLLVWVGIREYQQRETRKSAEVQVAINQKSVPATGTLPSEIDKVQNAAPSVAPVGAPDSRQDASTRDSARMLDQQLTAAGRSSGQKDSPQLKTEPAQQNEPTPKAYEYKAAATPSPAPQVLEEAKRDTGIAVESVPAAPVGEASGAVAKRTESTQLYRKKATDSKQKEANAIQTQTDMDTTSAMTRSQGATAEATAAFGQAPVVNSPDARVAWRLTPGVGLELTTDRGKTWKFVPTGVTTELTAASAPTSKICWVAGKAGTLLLTTDRGAHWTRIQTPTNGDLGGVHAVDATHATVWSLSNREAYETGDGGATWTRVANE